LTGTVTPQQSTRRKLLHVTVDHWIQLLDAAIGSRLLGYWMQLSKLLDAGLYWMQLLDAALLDAGVYWQLLLAAAIGSSN